MKARKSPALTGLFILIPFFLHGCHFGNQRSSTLIVQTVNEHTLTSKQFANQLARRLKNFDALAAKDPNNIIRIKEEILKDFLVKGLTLDWARSKNIVISEDTLDAEVNKLRGNYPDDLSFRRALAHENISFADWREELRFTLIEREVFKRIGEKIKPPEESEINSFYDAHKDRFKIRERVYLRQIVVDDLAKADTIKNDLKTKDFGELARKYSITPEGKLGGVLGWIEKGTVDYFDPLFSAGSTLQTVKSPFGVHIIKVDKKAPATILSITEAKSQIIRDLRAQREQAEYISWLDAQLRSSKIMKNEELVKAIKIETRGPND